MGSRDSPGWNLIDGSIALPSGKRLHSYGQSPSLSSVNQLFLWSIFDVANCNKLSVSKGDVISHSYDLVWTGTRVAIPHFHEVTKLMCFSYLFCSFTLISIRWEMWLGTPMVCCLENDQWWLCLPFWGVMKTSPNRCMAWVVRWWKTSMLPEKSVALWSQLSIEHPLGPKYLYIPWWGPRVMFVGF